MSMSGFRKGLENAGVSCAHPRRLCTPSSGCGLGSALAWSGLSRSEGSSGVSLRITKEIILVSGPKATSKDLWVSNLWVSWTNESLLRCVSGLRAEVLLSFQRSIRLPVSVPERVLLTGKAVVGPRAVHPLVCRQETARSVWLRGSDCGAAPSEF